MTIRASAKFSGRTGAYFNQAHFLIPISDAATAFNVMQVTTGRTSATTAFFTAVAAYMGTTDTTDWTADTPKTIYSHTGKGRFAWFLGPTAGGSETTTLEITIDGVLKEIPCAVASGERALFTTYMGQPTDEMSTTSALENQGGETMNAAKTGFTDQVSGTVFMLPWRSILVLGIPVLRYDVSLLVRAKHSQNITNSTATAYSAMQHIAGT